MTLKNARRRFEYLGFEVEHESAAAPRKYRARPIGSRSLRWLRATCLETLLAICEREAKA